MPNQTCLVPRPKENNDGAHTTPRSRHATHCYIAVVLLFSCLTFAHTQGRNEGGADTKILALEHAWNPAEERKDIKALDGILDDSIIYVDDEGTLRTKAAVSGDIAIERFASAAGDYPVHDGSHVWEQRRRVRYLHCEGRGKGEAARKWTFHRYVRGQPGHGDRALTYLQISPVFIAHEHPIDANCGTGCGSCLRSLDVGDSGYA